jgi:hypothetical protein
MFDFINRIASTTTTTVGTSADDTKAPTSPSSSSTVGASGQNRGSIRRPPLPTVLESKDTIEPTTSSDASAEIDLIALLIFRTCQVCDISTDNTIHPSRLQVLDDYEEIKSLTMALRDHFNDSHDINAQDIYNFGVQLDINSQPVLHRSWSLSSTDKNKILDALSGALSSQVRAFQEWAKNKFLTTTK